jgi:hypothetical protein
MITNGVVSAQGVCQKPERQEGCVAEETSRGFTRRTRIKKQTDYAFQLIRVDPRLILPHLALTHGRASDTIRARQFSHQF